MKVYVTIIFVISFLITACYSSRPNVQDLAAESSKQVNTPRLTENPISQDDYAKSTALMTPTAPSAASTPTPGRIPPVIPTYTPNVMLSIPFEMCSPLDGDTIPELWEIISDPYKPPPPGKDERHHGVDFAYYTRKDKKTIEGTVVFAIMSGKVAAVINDRLPYGNMIILETPVLALPEDISLGLDLKPDESIYHLYAHMAQPSMLQIGDTVACGHRLGEVGKTGYYVVNAHLHLETRKGKSASIFPNMAFYDTSASQDEMDNYIRWRTSGDFTHFDPMDLFSSYLTWLAESKQSEIEQEQ